MAWGYQSVNDKEPRIKINCKKENIQEAADKVLSGWERLKVGEGDDRG